MTSEEKDILLLEKDALLLEQQKQNDAQQKQIEELKFQLDQLRKLVFGSKRERVRLHTNPDQGNLFGHNTSEPKQEEQISETKLIKKGKPSRKGITRNTFPSQLAREEKYIYPDNYDEINDEIIGEDVTEILDYKAASLSVKKIIRPICKTKDKKINQAPIPPRIIPKGMVDESVISHIINEKIQHHNPLFRQAKKLKQQGLSFVKKTNIENWFSKGIEALVPLYHLHEQEVLSQDYLQVDESGIKVLQKNKKDSAHRGQMWVANDPITKSVLFKYDPSRSTQAATTFLKNFKGSNLQSDGYSVYENIAKQKHVNLIYCAAHARRKFKEALDKKEHPKLCEQGLSFYQDLYALERNFRESKLDHKQREEKRKQLSIPVLIKFKEWLDLQINNPEIIPDDRLAKAIAYTYKRWNGLIAYCQDGRLEIDNNLVENTIRPLALGRKNYLFAGSDYGAQNLAIGYSLVNTCIKNNINPEKYLCWVLKKIANNKVNDEAKNWLPQNLNEDNYQKLKI